MFHSEILKFLPAASEILSVSYCNINIYAEQQKQHGKKLPEWLTGKFPSFNKSDGSVIFAIDSVTEWNELRRRIAAEIVTLQDLRP